MNSKIAQVILTFFFALFFVSVQAAPAQDVAEFAERAICGAHMGWSCLSVEETSAADAEPLPSLTDDTFGPLETPSESPELTSEVPSTKASSSEAAEPSETLVSHLPSTENEPTHKPDTISHVDQDTPVLESPVAAFKTNGALTEHKFAFVFPVLLVTSSFILLA